MPRVRIFLSSDWREFPAWQLRSVGPEMLPRETLAVVSLFMDQLRTTSAARQRHPESDPDSCSVAQLLPSRLRNRLRRECDEFFARTRCDELANGARLPVGFAAPIY